RGGDASAFAPAAVFGGQHELDAEALKPIEIKELRLPPRPIEKRRAYAMTPQRFAKRGERGEPDAAGDHPRFRRRIDDRERSPERAEAVDALPVARVVEEARRDADAFVEQRDSAGRAVRGS